MSEDSRLTYATTADPTGIEIIDRVEQLRYQLYTPESVSPTPVSPDSFVFPVGRGLRLQTDEFSLPSDVAVVVRDGDGGMLTNIEHLESESLGPGEYIFDLSSQIKSYIRVEGPVEITSGVLQIRFEFEEPTDVDVGFRSRHTQPAATVTTTGDPTDVMAAISTFGSALKSTSPERSFPTLRGHPPQVELGDSLHIPEGVEPPDTGITIEVPPNYEAIFPVASLAYYLGAEVVPGNHPTLRTTGGFEYHFDYPHGFEADVAAVLKQVFLLDCVARTEGFYKVDLHERAELDRRLDLDWAALYDQPIAERVATYLQVPHALVEDHVPEWRLTAHVDPAPVTVEQLPFVVDDLAVVRTVETGATASGQSAATAPEPGPTSGDIVPSTEDPPDTRADGGDVLMRSASSTDEPATRSTTGPTADATFVEPDATDSLEQAWIGDHIPIGASKLTTEAFQNRLDREVTDDDISITIVLNDARMDEERDLVNQAYGDRDNLPFDVAVRRNLTVDQLRECLQEERSFLHYIGHIDEDGFECTDGRFDASTLEETGVDSFLLNACSSYQQGLGLIEAGAIGGIVTLTDIISDRAVEIGEIIARLLNGGFPLRAALTIAREESVLGGQYIVVGDGGMTVTQPQSRTPIVPSITPQDDQFDVEIRTFVTDSAGLGSIYTPYLEGVNEYYLTSGGIGTFSAEQGALGEFLNLADVPVRTRNDSIRWSSTVDPDDL